MPDKKTKKFDCHVLGKVIGTYEGWENLPDDDGDASDIFIFSSVKRNLLGKKAFPDFIDGQELVIYFLSGSAMMFDVGVESDEGVDLTIDWSVFNVI